MKIKLFFSPAPEDMEDQLVQAFEQARLRKADLIEISYGTHAGETKKRILNFLMKKEYRTLYSRLVKSKEGWGRVFVYFRWD